jgi:NADH dehydrogenase
MFEIGYERLVVALGAVTRTLPVPGLAEHGRGFKDVADAIALRNHLLRSLESAAARLDPEEAARDLGFVFVGAGHDLAHEAVRRSYPTLRGVAQRWVLVDAAPRILSEIPRKLGEYTHRYLERRGVEIRVSTTLESFDSHEAVLSDGTRVPARTLVWAAGVRPSPDLSHLDVPLDERGRVTVDPTLQVTGTSDVWALGDCAAVPNTRTPDRFDPPTCQHALRQARRLAKNLKGPPRPYGYRMLGQVATLGRYRGIAELPGLRLRGFLGWFVARTYHLYALPTFRRKMRVVTDWTVALFFRRDIVELSALGRPHELGP